MNRFNWFVIVLLGCCIVATYTPAMARPRSDHDLTTQQIAARSLPAIVGLTIRDSTGIPVETGSGIVVGKNLVATCWHVVNGAHTVTANFSDGRSETVPGLLGVDPVHDVALLSVHTGNIAPLEFGPVPPLGANVVAIGNPEELDGTISTGIVSGVRMQDLTRVVQTTAPISQGSSGGALLDTQGRVVGVTASQRIEGQNLNFAIVSDYVKLLFPTDVSAQVITWDSIPADNLQDASNAPSTTQAPAPPASTEASAPPSATPSASHQQDLNSSFLNIWQYDTTKKEWEFSGVDQVKAALSNGADVNARDVDGGTALMFAAAAGETDVVKLLLDAGADKNAKDKVGVTALIDATMGDQIGVVALLLGAGANKDIADKDGKTALIYAAVEGYIDVAKALLAAGANKDAKETIGATALIEAAYGGHTDLEKVLLDAGADKDATVQGGVTALMYAAEMGFTSVAKVLLDAGADKEARDKDGLTALMYAAYNGQADVANLLINAGANKDAKNSAGVTALDYANSPAATVSADAKAATIAAIEGTGAKQ